ncbi:MAG TPA: hypothetical protein VKC60_07135 [Opitutaceae bacterium]|nr:hypothetical protein [Opitutaceae bacterium]
MPDPLDELRAQRDLVAQHLAWLDRQIAARSGKPAPGPTPASLAPSRVSGGQATSQDSQDVAIERLIEQYQSKPADVHKEVKRGCVLYLFLAFGLIALALTAIYLLTPHPEPETPAQHSAPLVKSKKP